MRRMKLGRIAMVGVFSLALAPGLFAAKGGNGGGGKGGGGSGTAGTLGAIVTFRDCTSGFPSGAFSNLNPNAVPQDLCPVAEDRVKSDTGFSYDDGIEGVEAFFGSKANFGNLWLRLARSPRGLWLDFTDCASPAGECNPPFASSVVLDSAVKVDANNVNQDGLLGMTVGQSISAPMRIYYQPAGADAPGFVDFAPGQGGKETHCKNQGSLITVTRTSDNSWEVIGDPNTLGCVTLPGGAFGGTYRMPFQFTVQVK